MARYRSSETSFRQMEYCPLCRLNHKKRKKHIYSKHHQEILKSIIRKFSTKIHSIKQNLFSPKVEDGNFEFGAKFWCYFCKSEYLKHDILEMTTIIGAGLLEHIASEEHKENLVQFFWDNLMDKNLKPRFILSQEDLCISKKSAFLAVKRFQKSNDIWRKQLALKIKQEESVWQQQGKLSQSDLPTSTTQLTDLPGDYGAACATASLRCTLRAQGPGLTSVMQNKHDTEEQEKLEGNVHTGATPPWLKSDANDPRSNEIGPTMEDYQKHLEKEQKAKLPSTRVGANFDRKTSTSQHWLPSFGRVWSKGRRLQSKIHFEKEWKGHKQTKPRVATATAELKTSSNERTQSLNTDNYNLQHTSWSGSTANTVSPYRRSVESHDQQSIPTVANSHAVVSYKRKRDNDDENRYIQLLQTPLLADKTFNSPFTQLL